MTNTDSRFNVSVVITDLETGNVTSAVDVPEHLAENWTHEDMAQWAVERDDATVGRRVLQDATEEPDTFGERGESYTLYYRAGARFQVAVTVTMWEGRYKVTASGIGTTGLFTDESVAMDWADRVDGTLGITEVVV